MKKEKKRAYLEALRAERSDVKEGILETMMDSETDEKVRQELAKAYTAEVNAEVELAKAEQERRNGYRTLIVDGLKIIVPVVTAGMTIRAYNRWNAQIIKFEETGRFISTASKDLKLPQPKI